MLQLRQKRTSPDLFVDSVDNQLTMEGALLQKVQAALREKHAEAIEVLRLLRASSVQITDDQNDKTVSEHIDSTCRTLDTSGPINLFRDTMKAATSGVAATPAAWDKFTDVNVLKSVATISSSRNLRGVLDILFKNTADQLLVQANRTEEEFNTRLAEYNDARNVALQQLAKVKIEITAQDIEIAEVSATISSRENPLMLATTRLGIISTSLFSALANHHTLFYRIPTLAFTISC